jgi:perosamine synthetase
MFCDVPVHTPVAFSLPGRAINLPSYHDMTDADQRRVIDVVRTVLEGKL